MGIGTNSPGKRLTVKSDVRAIFFTETDGLSVGTDDGTQGLGVWYDAGAGDSYLSNLWDNVAGKIHFGLRAASAVNANVKMSITDTGR